MSILFSKEMASVNTELNNYTFAVYVLEILIIIILHLILFFVNIRLRSLMGTFSQPFLHSAPQSFCCFSSTCNRAPLFLQVGLLMHKSIYK